MDGERALRLRRRRPSRGRLALRRVLAALVLLGVLGVAAWVGAAVLQDDEPPPPATAGPPPLEVLRIVFPEGYTVKQMGERVDEVRRIAIEKRKVRPRLTAKGYLAAARALVAPKPFRTHAPRGEPEGFLFPALYEFTKLTTAKELVAAQLAAFERNWKRLDLSYARSRNLTPYDVLIIASMVEKEAVVPKERPLVAAVIYNRLAAGMPLGIDATIRYGLDVPGTEALRVSQLESDNPYNTRKRTGLPPTPIANPGLASLKAAAQPARVDYLYFVRKPDRRHHYFTASEAEFYEKACEYGFGC
jgi:uncharacterized YceG family protein